MSDDYEREDQDRDEYNQGRMCYEEGYDLPPNQSSLFKQGYAWQKKVTEEEYNYGR